MTATSTYRAKGIEGKSLVLFHFKLESEGPRTTRPSSCDELINLKKAGQLICFHPAWMLAGKEVFTFEGEVEGKAQAFS